MADLPVIEPPSLDIPTCCGTSSAAAPHDVTTRFHFSLNVSDIETSVAFYRKLFNCPPAKHHGDYAKFELSEPPLVFSLVPNAPGSQGSLSHLGFPVSSTEEVQATAARLAAAGLSTTCQDGTVCGYARQDKVWVADPDSNYWEIYVVHEDVDPATVRSAYDGEAPEAYAPAVEAKAPERQIYEHRVTDTAPDWSGVEEGSVDEVRLTGTFNSALSDDDRLLLLKEAVRILKAGGELNVHGLVSSAPVGDVAPNLPGVASLVKRIPTEDEPLRELAAAGLAGVRITKLPESPVFQTGALEMREIKVSAFKPSERSSKAGERTVVYKGPFAQATDDSGQVYRRGVRTVVTAEQEELLARSSAAKSFLFIQDETTCGAGASC
ncbi:ArsI/CadI family heavy metal resistance metalloenzyme [Planctomyces sp. SH-PL14]|uniref:ArsI/CadI family heavy metal resistance metalloenzyme n=1 Tax=Planctomyces sp. SH-PL14 TaxID=1632864 RepID=UPI00078B4EE6|nr:ArsI/CadI family heavy metal resistance metalloenzyme [Planctomyces sp. SH-PL14]AMV20474.1 Cadmium-induced protein CadI [Planctomyces sp. SH-PL14]